MGILIRSDLVVIPTQINDCQNLEIQKVTIKLINRNLDIINVYNPSPQTTYEMFEKCFKQVDTHYYIVIGDFNSHHDLWSMPNTVSNASGNALVKLLEQRRNLCLASPKGLATYLHHNGTKSAIDLCFCSSMLLPEISVQTGPCLGSDHLPVLVDLNIAPVTQKVKLRKRYLTKNVNWEAWRSGLPKLEWSNNLSMNNAIELFMENVKSSSHTIKESSGMYNPKYSKDWWNEECAKLVALRRRAKNRFSRYPTEHNLRILREAENKAKDKIKESKDNSWKTYATSINFSTNTTEVWNKIKRLQNKYKPPTNVVINNNNQLITDPLMKAEIFANHFEKKFNNKLNNLSINNMVLTVQNSIVKENSEEYNKPIKMHEIEYAVKQMKKTSPGIDGIDNAMLKNLPLSYYNYILELFNLSWETETFPESWKISLLIPISKPEKNNMLVESYRPISMLSCLGKIMERIINSRLNWYIENNNKLIHEQVGFRRKKSTYDLITNLETEIQSTLYKNETCIVAYLDLAAAFDNVSHEALLYKLSQMGIEGRLLGWLQAYLTDRTFRVMFEGETSSKKNITSGVPQGGILSPLLFNVLLCDLPKTKNVTMSVYADDISIYCSHKDVDTAFTILQDQINKLHVWAKCWGQHFNLDKAIKIMFFNKNRAINPNEIAHIQQRNYEFVNEFKFLGMTFDSPKLTWSRHINKLRANTLKRVNILKSITNNHWGSNRDSLLKLYASLIRSKIDYCSHLYSSATKDLLKLLDNIQNQCLRICLGARHTTPIVSLQAEAVIPPLELRRTELGLKYLARIMEQPPLAPIVMNFRNYYYGNKTFCCFFKSMKNILMKWNMNPPVYNSQWTNKLLPPWEQIKYINMIFPVNVNKRNDHQILDIFKDMCNNEYKNHHHYYTDGSKSDNYTGAAFLVDETNVKMRLYEESSVLTAELIAILKACEHALQFYSNEECVIFTDSLSSLLLLNSVNPKTFCNIAIHIQNILLRQKEKLKLQWIPGHRSIPGNDKADMLAKTAVNEPYTPMSLPVEDYNKVIISKMYKEWYKTWHNIIIRERKGTALFSIKDKLEVWPWTSHSIRSVETAITRLRLGHAGVAQHLFRFNMAPTPLCDCNSVETIAHYLLECQLYNNERQELINCLKIANINEPLSLKLLLGGCELSLDQQKVIVDRLQIYLKNTNKLFSL